MFARVYLILGTLVLLGYGLAVFEGWEPGNPVRLASAPPPHSYLRSSSSGGSWYWMHSTSSSSGGRSSGIGGTGGK
jgi:hypothetical protein